MSDAVARLSAALADRYRIERELGAGGMATLYLAHDLRHGRKVALKVLRPELSAILGAERFLAEIRTTANLQHPHILSLYDSGEADGLVFYVMPFVEGESLRERLRRERQLPIDDAVRIAREVADALDYAHRRGVIHRDVKPENVLLHDGRALVADFGIALAVSRSDRGTRLTETGMSLGTPHYMSPEQAMGERDITPRSDVYALGCVLYEMLSGEPPFTGPTAQAIIARVVTEQVRPLGPQRHTIPAHVEAAVYKALEKLPADRFASAAQFGEVLSRPDLMAARAGVLPAVPETRRPAVLYAPVSPRVRYAGLALAGMLAAVGAWGWLRPRERPAPPPVTRFTLSFEGQGAPRDQGGTAIAVSPDGSRIVYAGRDSARIALFVRALDGDQPAVIPGTRGANHPFFSPDGEWLGFQQDGTLRKVSMNGGAVVTVADAAVQGASWGDDDHIVFASQRRLLRVPASGGVPDTLVVPDSVSMTVGLPGYRSPDVLPGGRTVVFTKVDRDGPELAVLSIDERRVIPLGQEGMSPRYVTQGFLVFTQLDGTLFAAPFDPRRGRLTGRPQPVAEGVRTGVGSVAKVGVSRRGTVAYLSGSAALRDLVVADRQGRARALPLAAAHYRSPGFSPDGRQLVLAIDDGSAFGGDLWTFDFALGTAGRLTFDSVSILPRWSADGRRVVYTRGQVNEGDVYAIAADGSEAPQLLVRRPGPQVFADLSPDGRTVVFAEPPGVGMPLDVWVAPVDSPVSARPLVNGTFNETSPTVSPDGQWLAYASDETGSSEVYVRRFGESGGRQRVSANGGTQPQWSRSGRALYYRGGDSLYVAPAEPGPELRIASPRAIIGGAFDHGYGVSPDGRSFVYARQREAEVGGLQVILNWFDQPGRRR